MIKVLTFFIFLIISTMIFCVLDSIVKRMSYDISRRFLHVRLIISSVLFSLVTCNPYTSGLGMLSISRFLNIKAVDAIVSFICPQKELNILFLMLCLIGMNFLFAVLFIAMISIVKLVFSRKQEYIVYEEKMGLKRYLALPWLFVNKYYGKNGVLKEKGVSIGIWIKRMKFATVIIWLMEMLVLFLAIVFGGATTNSVILKVAQAMYLVPIEAFFVIEQIQYFFEKSNDYGGMKYTSVSIPEVMIGNVNDLLGCYVDSFDDTGSLLYAEYGSVIRDNGKGLLSNDLSNAQKERCKDLVILEIITNTLKKSSIYMNSDYQDALISLINGDAVCIRDNPVGEFSYYYCAYINYYLSLGKNAVILCSDFETVESVKGELELRINHLKGLGMFWNISTVEDFNDKSNVLICTYNEFLVLDIETTYASFSKENYIVVFPDCLKLVALDNISLSFIFGKLKSCKSLERYIFIASSINDILKNKIKELLPVDMGIVSHMNDARKSKTAVMVWKGESGYKLQCALGIGNSADKYLGTAIPLALVAIKYDFPKVSIVSSSISADKYYIEDAFASNNASIAAYVENRDNIKNMIKLSASEATIADDMKVIVVYDEDYNLFTTLWKWFKYAASNGTLIHVVSPFYMLREFFAANYEKLLDNNSAYASIVPDETVLKRSRYGMLLAELACSGMTEEKLLRISERYGFEQKTDVKAILLSALSVVRLNTYDDFFGYFAIDEHSEFISKPKEYIHKWRSFRLTNNQIKNELFSQLQKARMYLNNEHVYDLDILAKNLTNYYLRDQIFVYNNRYFSISSIENGIIQASLTEPEDVHDYYPISDYNISNVDDRDSYIDHDVIDYNLVSADVDRRIYGYVASPKGNNFAKSSGVEIKNFDDAPVDVFMEKVPVLEIGIQRSLFNKYPGEDVPERAIRLLAVLFNGLFKTLYPETYQNIVAIPDIRLDYELRDDVLIGKNKSVSGITYATIPGINESIIGEEGKDYIYLYIIEFSCIEYGMIDSIYKKKKSILTTIYQYLNWYINGQKLNSSETSDTSNMISGTYLNFGSNTIVDIFAAEELLGTLGYALTLNEIPMVSDNTHKIGKSNVLPTTRCTFCGKKFVFGWSFDERMMCGHCHDHQLTEEQQVRDLFINTKEQMENVYGFEFSKNITVRFQSAKNIRQYFGVKDGRVLGFYSPKNRELWIESRGPAVSMQCTISHELTHAWQDDFLPSDATMINALGINGDKKWMILYEGHASYVEIDAMIRFGEMAYAESERASLLGREDEYGIGYRVLSEYFDLQESTDGALNPFNAMKDLCDAIIRGEDPINWSAVLSEES